MKRKHTSSVPGHSEIARIRPGLLKWITMKPGQIRTEPLACERSRQAGWAPSSALQTVSEPITASMEGSCLTAWRGQSPEGEAAAHPGFGEAKYLKKEGHEEGMAKVYIEIHFQPYTPGPCTQEGRSGGPGEWLPGEGEISEASPAGETLQLVSNQRGKCCWLFRESIK